MRDAKNQDPPPPPHPAKPRNSHRDDLFTRFLERLGDGASPPDPELCAAVRRKLRDLLVREMQRSSLWNAPPSYLGVPGTRWSEEALEELVAECYAFSFVHRLRSLQAQLRVKSSVEGLIVRNVRNFLYDTQKRHDPLGFRVFDLVRSAILDQLENGRLVILGGSPQLRNDTLLAAPGVDQREIRSADAAGSSVVDFEEVARRWNGELLPELVTARGRETAAVVARLGVLLVELCREIGGFRLEHLVGPLKNDARRQWGALWDAQEETALEDAEDPQSPRVPVVQPRDALADRQYFARLVAEVDERLAGLEARRRTRGYLERLWVFHRQLCAEPAATLPSQRELARRLGIPRYRLPELTDRLGEVVAEARRALTPRRTKREATLESSSWRPTDPKTARAARAAGNRWSGIDADTFRHGKPDEKLLPTW